MNQLETNLVLWAICSIILFEILFIICLCRCCFNRIKPKKFYIKREEYQYLQDIHTDTESKQQSTILRPPHADELALVGTIRGENSFVKYSNGLQNFGFYRDDEDQRTLPIQSQHWIELQPSIINTAHLPPADYEIHSYPTDDYLYTHPFAPHRPTIIDFRPYINEDDEIERFRFQSLRRPEIILPQVRRIDTSTEAYGINYSNIIPKSILKSGTSSTPTLDLPSTTPYLQTQHSLTSSNYDESPQTSVKNNTIQSVPIEPILSSLSSIHRMRFASVSQLNDIEWEVPREFQKLGQNNNIFHSDRQRTPSASIDSRWQHIQPHYLSKDDITQQQALEY